MGNWRTVNLIGSCDASEVAALSDAIRIDDIMDSSREWLPLCSGGGLAALPD